MSSEAKNRSSESSRPVNYGSTSAASGEGADNSRFGDSGEDGKQEKTFHSRREKLVFLCLALNNIIVSICFATMAPFFPTTAATKAPGYVPPIPPTAGTGAPVTSTPTASATTLIGLVFSVATFTDFVFSPFVGKELPNVGPKLVFLLGSILVAGVTILFSFVDMVDDWVTFLALCYALRAVQGIGTACMFTASFTILVGAFPQSVGVVSGSLEIFSGVGFMVGPAIGGALFSHGGFKMPFLVSGGALAVSTFLVALVLPPAEHKKEEKLSLLDVVKQPRTFLMICTALLSAASLGFLDPSLGPFLDSTFKLSPAKIGLVFLIGAGVYAVLAPIVGFIADKFSPRPLIPCGLVLTGFAYQLIGPNPLLHLQPALWRTLTGLALMGMGIGMSLVPTSPDMLLTMREAGYKDSMALHSAIGGVMGAAFSLGEGLGPSVGGVMDGAVGFRDAASIFGAMLLATAILVTVGTLLGRLRDKVRSGKDIEQLLSIQEGEDDDEEEGEAAPLLSERTDGARSRRALARRSLSHSRVPSVDIDTVLAAPPSQKLIRALSVGASNKV